MEQYAKRVDGWCLCGLSESDGAVIQNMGHVESC